MRWIGAVSMFLCGCEEDIAASTRVRSLQIVSMVSEPKKVSPHEAASLTVTIADPDHRGADVAVWMCTPVGDSRTCLEAEAAIDAQPVAVGSRDPDTHSATFEVVPMPISVAEIDTILDEGTDFRGVLAFALACAPGLCPLFDDIASDTVRPEDLADPDRLLQGLPMDGVSLAWRSITLTRDARRDRDTNPVIAPLFDVPIEARAGRPVDLAVEVDGDFSDGRVFPLATIGGFSTASTPTGPATPTLEWRPPDHGGKQDGHIYMVVDDGQGGQAVWFGPARVQE